MNETKIITVEGEVDERELKDGLIESGIEIDPENQKSSFSGFRESAERIRKGSVRLVKIGKIDESGKKKDNPVVEELPYVKPQPSLDQLQKAFEDAKSKVRPYPSRDIDEDINHILSDIESNYYENSPTLGGICKSLAIYKPGTTIELLDDKYISSDARLSDTKEIVHWYNAKSPEYIYAREIYNLALMRSNIKRRSTEAEGVQEGGDGVSDRGKIQDPQEVGAQTGDGTKTEVTAEAETVGEEIDQKKVEDYIKEYQAILLGIFQTKRSLVPVIKYDIKNKLNCSEAYARAIFEEMESSGKIIKTKSILYIPGKAFCPIETPLTESQMQAVYKLTKLDIPDTDITDQIKSYSDNDINIGVILSCLFAEKNNNNYVEITTDQAGDILKKYIDMGVIDRANFKCDDTGFFVVNGRCYKKSYLDKVREHLKEKEEKGEAQDVGGEEIEEDSKSGEGLERMSLGEAREKYARLLSEHNQKQKKLTSAVDRVKRMIGKKINVASKEKSGELVEAERVYKEKLKEERLKLLKSGGKKIFVVKDGKYIESGDGSEQKIEAKEIRINIDLLSSVEREREEFAKIKEQFDAEKKNKILAKCKNIWMKWAKFSANYPKLSRIVIPGLLVAGVSFAFIPGVTAFGAVSAGAIRAGRSAFSGFATAGASKYVGEKASDYYSNRFEKDLKETVSNVDMEKLDELEQNLDKVYEAQKKGKRNSLLLKIGTSVALGGALNIGTNMLLASPPEFLENTLRDTDATVDISQGIDEGAIQKLKDSMESHYGEHGLGNSHTTIGRGIADPYYRVFPNHEDIRMSSLSKINAISNDFFLKRVEEALPKGVNPSRFVIADNGDIDVITENGQKIEVLSVDSRGGLIWHKSSGASLAEEVPNEKPKNIPETKPEKNNPTDPNNPNNGSKPAPSASTVDSIESVEFSPNGSIQTIKNLQALINDDENIPESVKDIFKGNPEEVTQKLGLWKPGSGDESALLMKGDRIVIKENGIVAIEKTNGDSLILVDSKGQIRPYDGKMFHSELSKIVSNKRNIQLSPISESDLSKYNSYSQYKVINPDSVPSRPEIQSVGTGLGEYNAETTSFNNDLNKLPRLGLEDYAKDYIKPFDAKDLDDGLEPVLYEGDTDGGEPIGYTRLTEENGLEILNSDRVPVSHFEDDRIVLNDQYQFGNDPDSISARTVFNTTTTKLQLTGGIKGVVENIRYKKYNDCFFTTSKVVQDNNDIVKVSLNGKPLADIVGTDQKGKLLMEFNKDLPKKTGFWIFGQKTEWYQAFEEFREKVVKKVKNNGNEFYQIGKRIDFPIKKNK